MENQDYLSLLFDVNRGGFLDVAEKILSYLDYASFIKFKQSCKVVYNFISSSNIEQLKLRRKLKHDWQFATHKEQPINAPGLVNTARIYANSQKIVCGVDETVMVSDSITGDRLLTLHGHKAIISSVDLFSVGSRKVLAVSKSQ